MPEYTSPKISSSSDLLLRMVRLEQANVDLLLQIDRLEEQANELHCNYIDSLVYAMHRMDKISADGERSHHIAESTEIGTLFDIDDYPVLLLLWLNIGLAAIIGAAMFFITHRIIGLLWL